jgi:predicted lactoylglutathione lyase
MNKQIFLNIPVADLPKSMSFYQALGYSLNPQFTGDSAACVVINETTFVMLGTHAKFREFTPKAICDTTQTVEVLITLSCASRQEVDDLVAKAVAAGGSTYDKAEDFGFMYTHSFVDPDGHGWGLFHMSAPPTNP